MGIVASIPLLTSEGIKKYKSKRAAHKQRNSQIESQHSTAQSQQTRRSQSSHADSHRSQDTKREERDSVEILRQGLVSEHLATTFPPVVAGVGTAEERGTYKGNIDSSRTESVLDPSKPQSHETSAEAEVAELLSKRKTNITMASDSDYASFLDKVNQEPSGGRVESKKSGGDGKMQFKATEKSVTVPTVLKKAVVDAFYVSDADEPFEVVGLKVEGGKLPDEATFAKTIEHPAPKEAEIDILDVAEWDPQGQYKEIVDAVREASKGGDVRVYKVSSSGARVEYWVVTVYEGKLLGVKALSVES